MDSKGSTVGARLEACKSAAQRSKTFCAIPFVSQMTHPDGGVALCCMADWAELRKENGRAWRLPEDRLADAWNGSAMRSIRRQMLIGQDVTACAKCIFQEKQGKISHRLYSNFHWQQTLGDDLYRRAAEAELRNYAVDEPPVFLDLRFGNGCNLMCRMCSPDSSSRIAREVKKRMGDEPEFKKFRLRLLGPPETEAEYRWYMDPTVAEDLGRLSTGLRKVYFAGGEPMLNGSVAKFVQNCAEAPHARELEVTFNTNGTIFNSRIVNCFSRFRSVKIGVSCDGIGAVNDYIRYPSRWLEIDGVIQRYLHVGTNVSVHLAVSVQAYNALYLDRVFEFVEARGARLGVEANLVESPEALSVRALPAGVRAEARRRLLAFGSRSARNRQGGSFGMQLGYCLEALDFPDDERQPRRFSEFVAYTAFLDKFRQQEFRRSLPELAACIDGKVADARASMPA